MLYLDIVVWLVGYSGCQLGKRGDGEEGIHLLIVRRQTLRNVLEEEGLFAVQDDCRYDDIVQFRSHMLLIVDILKYRSREKSAMLVGMQVTTMSFILRICHHV